MEINVTFNITPEERKALEVVQKMLTKIRDNPHAIEALRCSNDFYNIEEVYNYISNARDWIENIQEAEKIYAPNKKAKPTAEIAGYAPNRNDMIEALSNYTKYTACEVCPFKEWCEETNIKNDPDIACEHIPSIWSFGKSNEEVTTMYRKVN